MDILFNIGFGILCFIAISFGSCLIFLSIVGGMADIEKEKRIRRKNVLSL